jgi:uncharacterized protein (TIGR03083 family)
MPMDRDHVAKGYQLELAAFEELVRSLTPEQWEQPTRCDGWRVADVAAHVTGTLDNVVAGRFDGLGTPEVTLAEVEDRRGRTAAEVADELHACAEGAAALVAVFDDDAWAGPAPASVGGTLGDGVETLWYDTWLHGDDIRDAVGEGPELSRDALGASIRHIAIALADQGWGPATLALDGQAEVTVGGGGRRVTGDPYAFVLAATGRAAADTIGEDATINIYR